MSIDDVRNDFMAGKYTYHSDIPRKFKEGHVFDENQSVIWNRKEVERRNNEIVQMKNEAKDRAGELSQKLVDDAVSAIVEEYGVSRVVAQIVWDFSYREHHSNMFDVFGNISELVEFAEKILTEK